MLVAAISLWPVIPGANRGEIWWSGTTKFHAIHKNVLKSSKKTCFMSCSKILGIDNVVQRANHDSTTHVACRRVHCSETEIQTSFEPIASYSRAPPVVISICFQDGLQRWHSSFHHWRWSIYRMQWNGWLVFVRERKTADDEFLRRRDEKAFCLPFRKICLA